MYIVVNNEIVLPYIYHRNTSHYIIQNNCLVWNWYNNFQSRSPISSRQKILPRWWVTQATADITPCRSIKPSSLLWARKTIVSYKQRRRRRTPRHAGVRPRNPWQLYYILLPRSRLSFISASCSFALSYSRIPGEVHASVACGRLSPDVEWNGRAAGALSVGSGKRIKSARRRLELAELFFLGISSDVYVD